jgi:outer membrane protein
LFNYRRGGFFVRGISFGYGFGPSERLNFELFLGPNFRGYEAGDSAALEGMADRDPTAELGGRLIWRPEPLQVSFAATTDVLNVHGGQEVELELSRGFNVAQRLQLVPGVSGIWQSANYTDYYYGVDPDEARLGRPVYMPGSSVSVRGGVRLFRPLGRRWMLLAWALFEAYGSEITDSPIVEDSTALGGFIGFSYTFGQAGPPPGS